jgi:hypothetical protein
MLVDHMIAFVGGGIIAMMLSMKSMGRAVRLQQDILAKGVLTRGTVTSLWQPPLTGAFTRIYFEFWPSGGENPVRACHVDRRGGGEWIASLPQIGTAVAIRYLPEDPARAVIVKLVAR